MNKIKLLYYSKALTASHGGRLHSEAFVKEGIKNHRVKEMITFPASRVNTTYKKQEISDSFLKDLLKNNSLFQIVFFIRLNYLSYKEIVPIITSKKPDAIHLRITRNFLILKKLKKKFPGLIVTSEVNASPFDESFKNIAFKKYFRKLESRSLENADANFFVSSYLKDEIMKRPDPKRDIVVHNGVDLDLFKPLNSETLKKEVVFGYIGTLDFHKNLKFLIDALDIVVRKRTGEQIKLLIVGDGPMSDDLKDYVQKKDLDKVVNFSGWVDHNDIPEYLAKMDIAIHHSANPYMSPLKIFEYMAVGLPVIGPDIPSIKEILKNEKEILLVKSEIKDLSEKMIFLLENKSMRMEIAVAGQRKITTEYGWSNNAENILRIIQGKFLEKSNQNG